MKGTLRNLLVFITTLSLTIIAGSCSQVNQEYVLSTAEVMAATMNMQTHQAETAMTSNTPLPSATMQPTYTNIPTSTPIYKELTLVAAALTGTSTAAEAEGLSAYPTYTPLPFISKSQYATIRFVNSTGKQATVRINGAQIYEASVGKSTILKVRFDTYYFTIFIGNDGPYNGSILINSPDRYTIFIDESNIRVATP